MANEIDISGWLSSLLYDIGGNDYAKNGMTLNDIMNDSSIAISNKEEIKAFVNANGLGGMTMLDTSWSKAGEYETMYAATFELNGEMYVTYRGTGAGNWSYNAVAYDETNYNNPQLHDMQEWALKYFNYSAATYYEGQSMKNLYVTGHSQGGNNAQYATIMSPYADYITRCVSVDGLGFAQEAIDKAKAQFGESFYLRQIDKMFAVNGQFDYANYQGIIIIPRDADHTMWVETPGLEFIEINGIKIYFDITGFHSINYMLNAEGFNTRIEPNQNGHASVFGEFMALLVAQVNSLPEDQRISVMVTFFKVVENTIGARDSVISSDEFEKFKSTLVPILVKLMDKNPEIIYELLVELGFDKDTARAIADMLKHINSYPPEIREKALLAILQGLTCENGKIGFNWEKMGIPSAILNALPMIFETALFHPEDLLKVLHDLGVDVAIEKWLAENAGLVTCIVLGVGIFALVFPGVFLTIVGLASSLVIAIVAIIAIIDAVIRIVQGLKWLGEKAWQGLVTAFNAIKNAINAFAKWVRDWWEKKGREYAAANPYFKVDTAKLSAYATRIQNVNNRLSKLDSSLRSLYWQVGWLDLWDIFMANLLTSESPTLNQVKSYLNNAATRFDNAENKARGLMGG
jgi:hypothetical protein